MNSFHDKLVRLMGGLCPFCRSSKLPDLLRTMPGPELSLQTAPDVLGRLPAASPWCHLHFMGHQAGYQKVRD